MLTPERFEEAVITVHGRTGWTSDKDNGFDYSWDDDCELVWHNQPPQGGDLINLRFKSGNEVAVHSNGKKRQDLSILLGVEEKLDASLR